MRKFKLLLLALTVILFLSACGETLRGAGKDIHRIGKGIRMIFVSG